MANRAGASVASERSDRTNPTLDQEIASTEEHRLAMT
jgi:hypothetical protein